MQGRAAPQVLGRLPEASGLVPWNRAQRSGEAKQGPGHSAAALCVLTVVEC